ncbi:MAG: hypothetical protein EOR57_34195 [Mesorhizobium sp.]|uniref:hypothetical protein n=1 Tax=Mesorhizobium sp. TaxID=1871066 RepID=UPI000FE864F1|nr:hypothetical protein [Mesorhizobium sp.]RWL12045.1 MAG: hypothetical protein EOR57_34195 [Mesorhizobium sp.]
MSALSRSVTFLGEAIGGVSFSIRPTALEPGRARKAIHSHIDRANWMITTGYKELFRADEKGKAFAS